MMERSTVMKTFAGGLSHEQPVFDIREPSPPFVSFPQKKIATIRDASFSSYLKPQQQDNQVDDNEISIFDAQKYFNESSGGGDPRVSKRVSPVNVVNLESIPRFSSASSSVDGYGRNYRARSFHATPTASSEASWNSQTGLLSNPPGAIPVSMRNPPPGDEKRKGSATKWLLGRRCPCAGRKSVQVEEKLSEPRTTQPHLINHKANDHTPNLEKTIPSSLEKSSAATDHWLQRQEVIPKSHRISADNCFPSALGQHQHHHRLGRPFSTDGTTSGFSFPILNQTTSAPIKLVLNGLQSPPTTYNPQLEDPPRDSLEVFRPSDDPPPIPNNKTTVGDPHQRQSFTFPASPKSKMTITTDDDIASDASSDLFEIESFSTQTTSYQMFNNNNHGRRDSLDESSIFSGRRYGGSNGNAIGSSNLYCRQSLDEPRTPSIAPTECYEPSEASIDWSVTTAEGFDRGSVTNFSVTASEVDQQEMIYMRHHEIERSNIGEGGGGGGGSGGGGKKKGGLLSCRCEKAVSVGPHPVKCGGGGSGMTRHVSSRPPIANKPPLARSHSARLSLPFST